MPSAPASPSTVPISAPSAWTASMVHDLVGAPSTSTVHAPQCVVSQPMWVPVSARSSRIRWTSRRRESTVAECAVPFTVTVIWCVAMSLTSCARERLADGTGREHAGHVLLVFDGAAPVGDGLGGVGGGLRGGGDGGVAGGLAGERVSSAAVARMGAMPRLVSPMPALATVPSLASESCTADPATA